MIRFSGGVIALAGMLLFTAAAVEGAVVLEVGDHVLQPEQPDQTFTLSVSGGDEVAGLILALQIGDGASGPVITGIGLESGTIFDGNSAGQTDYATGSDQVIYSDVVTDSGTVSAEGIAAFITVDTTGLGPGTYDVILGGFDVGGFTVETEFLDDSGGSVELTTVAGTLTIVPEPTAGSLLLLGTAAALGRHRRRIGR